MANKAEKTSATAGPGWRPKDFAEVMETIQRDPATVKNALLAARRKGKSSLACPAPANDPKRKYRITLSAGKPTVEGEDTPGVWHPVALPDSDATA